MESYKESEDDDDEDVDDGDDDDDDDLNNRIEDDIVSKNCVSPAINRSICWPIKPRAGQSFHKKRSDDTELNAFTTALKAASVTMTTSTTTAIRRNSLRNRFTPQNLTNAMALAKRVKCAQFEPIPEIENYTDSCHSSEQSLTKYNSKSKQLKKIIFNGTFPIDDPYSSRF